ncbi:MAG: ligase-associated DNA damage response endonuclease PdeM [Casimicrobiaceae bacterium]
MTALPLFADVAAPATKADGVLACVVGGEAIELHAKRALYWPGARKLFVADVHLGKDAAFRAGGIPLPQGSTAADLARLSALIAATGATTLVVLGDFLHAASGRVATLDTAFRAWRAQHVAVEMILVRGNHDSHAGDPPPQWQVDVVSEPHAWPPFLGCHHPAQPASGYALCGHIHPGVVIGGAAQPSVRVPCFVIGPRRAILPAFGRFTGLWIMPPEPGDRIVAVAGAHLFALPSRK